MKSEKLIIDSVEREYMRLCIKSIVELEAGFVYFENLRDYRTFNIGILMVILEKNERIEIGKSIELDLNFFELKTLAFALSSYIFFLHRKLEKLELQTNIGYKRLVLLKDKIDKALVKRII